MDSLAAVLKRDRILIGLGVLLVTTVAWWLTIHEARRMDPLTMQMAGPDRTVWSAGSLLPLFLMWTAMMVAMMLPSATPMILTFAALARHRRQQQRPYVPVTVFIAGYIAVWGGFSILAAVAQWLLHRQALLLPTMASSSALFGGILLFLAGVFQFTPLKKRCLTRCQAPLEFITTRWRDGRAGAFAMGVEHGAFCTGCCWALMALLFVLGVMNLLWIAALTILVAMEKMLPRWLLVSPLSGLLLAGWAVWILAKA
jgi:predicted metal-binding membrane protein